MKISINEKSIEKLDNAIREAEGRATARCISAKEMIEYAGDFTGAYNIAKKAMVGLVVDVDINAQDFPSAYKYTPESTHFTMEYTTSGWKAIYIGREKCRPHTQTFIVLNMPEETKTALINRFSKMSGYQAASWSK